MGRTRTKSKHSKITAADGQPQSSKKLEPTVEALLEKAQTLIVQCDYELADKFVRRILEIAPQHVDAREMLGVIQLELGEVHAAKEVSTNITFVCLTY